MPAEVYNVWATLTPSNTVDLAKLTHAVYVGGAGDVAAVMQDNTVGTFTAVPAGSVLPIICRRVNATGTSATALLSLREV